MSLVRMICYYLEEGFHCSKKTSRLCSSLDFNCIVLLSDNCPRLLCSLIFLIKDDVFCELAFPCFCHVPRYFFVACIFSYLYLYLHFVFYIYDNFSIVPPVPAPPRCPDILYFAFFCIFVCFYFHFIPFLLWLPLAPASPPRCPG